MPIIQTLEKAGFSDSDIRGWIQRQGTILREEGYNDSGIASRLGQKIWAPGAIPLAAKSNEIHEPFDSNIGPDGFPSQIIYDQPYEVQKAFSDVVTPLAMPFQGIHNNSEKSLNMGLYTFSTHLAEIIDYAGENASKSKVGGVGTAAVATLAPKVSQVLKDVARNYEEKKDFWQKMANDNPTGFIPALMGEALGGAPQFITEFLLNVPYAGVLGTAQARKVGQNEMYNAILEAGKRGVLGSLFKMADTLNTWLRVPTMAVIGAAPVAVEGGTKEDIAKAAGGMALMGLASRGGKLGLRDIQENIRAARTTLEVKKLHIESGDRVIPQDWEAAAESRNIEYRGMQNRPDGPPLPMFRTSDGQDFTLEDGERLDNTLAELTAAKALRGFSVKDLVTCRTREELQGKLQEIFGSYSDLERVENKGGTRSQIKRLDIANKYMGDIEYAAIEKNEPEVSSLLDRAMDELSLVQKIPSGEIPTKSKSVSSTGPPPTGEMPPPEAQWKPGDPIYKRSDIVKLVEDELMIPVRVGHFRQRARGIYKIKEEVIRTGKANDIPTLSHEAGHHIYKFLYPEAVKSEKGAKGLSGDPVRPFANELLPIASEALSGQDPLTESFPEFVRMYVTKPLEAKNTCPTFYDFFESQLQEKAPEIKTMLLEAREKYQKWQTQPALYKALSLLSVGERPEVIGSKINDLVSCYFDDIRPMQVTENEMIGGRTLKEIVTGKEKLGAWESPTKMMRQLRGWPCKVNAFLHNKPFKFNTYEDVGKGLHEILSPINTPDELMEFRGYIFSRRTLELSQREIETGLLPSEAREVVKQLEPKYGSIFKDYIDFNDHVIQYVVDSGRMSQKDQAFMKMLNMEWVPLNVVADEYQKTYMGGKGYESPEAIIHRIRGSWRDKIDPLESTIKNVYFMINAAERNAVGQALVNLAKQKEGYGKYIEEVPIEMAKVATVSGEEIAKAAGLTPEEGTEFDALDIFRPSPFSPGQDHITVWDQGIKHIYKVHPEIARVFHGSDQASVNMLVELLKYPAILLRQGTVLSPTFSIGANLPRDQLTAFLGSRYGYTPLVDFIAGVYHLAKKDELYWMRQKAGANYATMSDLSRQFTQEELYNVLSDSPIKGKVGGVQDLPKVGLDLLIDMGKFVESGTRMQEFATGFNILTGKEKLSPTWHILHPGASLPTNLTPKQAALEAGYSSSEVTVNFSTGGTKTKTWRSIDAFFGAGLNGLKWVKDMAERDPVGLTVRIAAGLVIPSVLNAIVNHDNPRYKEAGWQRQAGWVIPTEHDTWMIRKPFELGLIASLAEDVTNQILDDDPHAFDGWIRAAGQVITPGVVPTGPLPFIENWANKDSFLDIPLLPEEKTKLLPEYQYGPYTSETAKALGKILGKVPYAKEMGITPVNIDNVMRDWTGRMGRDLISLLDLGLEKSGLSTNVNPDREWMDKLPIIQAFHIRYPSMQAESIRRFYDNLDHVNSVKLSEKQMKKEQRPEERLRLQRMMYAGDELSRVKKTMDIKRKTLWKCYYNPDLTGQEKHEFIDIMYEDMINLARAANERYDKSRKGIEEPIQEGGK